MNDEKEYCKSGESQPSGNIKGRKALTIETVKYMPYGR